MMIRESDASSRSARFDLAGYTSLARLDGEL
jgi:hypothetical protein